MKIAYETQFAAADKEIAELKQQVQNYREKNYQSAFTLMKNANTISDYAKAQNAMYSLNGYKDSKEYMEKCQAEIDRLNAEKRLEQERQAAIQKEEAKRAARKKKTIVAIIFVVFLLSVITMLMIPK